MELATIPPADPEKPNSNLWPQSIVADPNAILTRAPTNLAGDEWDNWPGDVDFSGGYSLEF